jgi:hypothetical protein
MILRRYKEEYVYNISLFFRKKKHKGEKPPHLEPMFIEKLPHLEAQAETGVIGDRPEPSF